jgi:cobalamin biosynthesis protein CobD/CbiB
MSKAERQIRRRRERKRDVQRADRAVGVFIAWFVGGMIALVVAILVFQSTALAIVVGGLVAVALLWRLMMRSQR